VEKYLILGLEAKKTDKFPEAFERFEQVVYLDRIQSFQQLFISFSRWAGRPQGLTRRQIETLKVEARHLGLRDIPQSRVHRPSFGFGIWQREFIKIRGKTKIIYRDLKTGRFIKKPF
jgi:hypothetical protein